MSLFRTCPTSRIVTFLFIIILLPFIGHASDVDLENDLQKALQQSKIILERAEAKTKSLQPADTEIKALTGNLEDIKASYLLLQERFRTREEKINSLGLKAAERHSKMSDGFIEAIEEYIRIIESYQQSAVPVNPNGLRHPVKSERDLDHGTGGAGSGQQTVINQLKTLLDKIIQKKKRPIFGTLPYKNLNYPAREPISEPSIKPAYKGGNKEVSPDDLKSTPEAPILEKIAALVQSLNWNPVLIYEHVKNNIETEWYWGCMKGAEETLRQGSGNDCDQATLLIALLRASGFPSRYVRGTIEFFAGGRDGIPIERAKNLTGIKDPLKIAEFFQKAGIPYKPVIQGGKIVNFQIDHIWIESEIPYANFRGTMLDEHGKIWLGLDTSIKVLGYEYNVPELSADSYQLSAIKDEYLSAIQSQTPLEYVRDYLNAELATRNPQLTYDDLLLTRSLIPEVMNILPASMQFVQKTITGEYTQIPEELIHKVRFTARDSNNSELLNIELRTFDLSNQQIVISYEPETVEDQEIINSYGGLNNTPSYLVRLRPVLKLNGERLIVAKDGLPMGEDFNLTIELISPNGTERIENTHITGNLSVIGIVAGKAVTSSEFGVQSEDKTAEQLLYEEAISYIDRWNQAEEELASLFHLAITRPIPTVVTIGGVIDVAYLLDTPHGVDWKGVYVDADLKTIETKISNQLPAIS